MARTPSKTVVRCDVCGLLKEAEVAGWRNIGIAFRSDSDSNHQNSMHQMDKHFQDLCPKCYKMVAARIVSAVKWATTL